MYNLIINFFIFKNYEIIIFFSFILLVLITLTSCNKNDDSSKSFDTNKLSAKVQDMVTTTSQKIISGVYSEKDVQNFDILFNIVQSYDEKIVLNKKSIERNQGVKSLSNEFNLSEGQTAILNKLELMATNKFIDFEEIKNDISLLPSEEQEFMVMVMAIVEGGSKAIDVIKTTSPDNSKGKAEAVLCNATTSGIASIWGAWSGAIAGAIYGGTVGGPVGVAVGIISGAILSAYVC